MQEMASDGVTQCVSGGVQPQSGDEASFRAWGQGRLVL